jgi:hypothetical protein
MSTAPMSATKEEDRHDLDGRKSVMSSVPILPRGLHLWLVRALGLEATGTGRGGGPREDESPRGRFR